MSRLAASRWSEDKSMQGQDARPEDDKTAPEITVKRPKRPKHGSRISFGRDAMSLRDEVQEDEGNVIVPKRGLARKAIERYARRSSPSPEQRTHGAAAETLPDQGARPRYSQEALEQLKQAQRSQVQGSEALQDNAFTSYELDIVSKSAGDLALHDSHQQDSLIPTDAEIQEKKARRARLAKLAKYNIDPNASEEDEPLIDEANSDEDEFLTQRDKISLRDARVSGKDLSETRLAPDDEDMLEGFDEFTNESGRVALGEQSKLHAETRRRAEMQDMINAAQNEDDNSENSSDQEQRDEYEETQTRAGVRSRREIGKRSNEMDDGARTPPRITPITPLTEVQRGIRESILQAEAARAIKLQRLEAINAEKKELDQREIDIQRLLKETALKYEKMAVDSTNQQSSNGVSSSMDTSTPDEAGTRMVETPVTP